MDQTLQFVIPLHQDAVQRANWRWSSECKVQSLTPSEYASVSGVRRKGHELTVDKSCT
jgi:hypothetical protein